MITLLFEFSCQKKNKIQVTVINLSSFFFFKPHSIETQLTITKKSMEKMGFEPMVQKKLYVDLANQCLKPLSHFSQ
jgi:hypothetical protein